VGSGSLFAISKEPKASKISFIIWGLGARAAGAGFPAAPAARQLVRLLLEKGSSGVV